MGQKVGCIYSLLTRTFVHFPLSLLVLAACLTLPPRAYAQVMVQTATLYPDRADQRQPLPQSATIQGTVWHDRDASGLLERSPTLNQLTQSRLSDHSTHEPAITGVDVSLFRVPSSRPTQANDNTADLVFDVLDLIASTTTNISGTFAFTDLPPGDYVVEFGQEGIQAGHRITEPSSSEAPSPRADDSIVSNVEPMTRRGPRVTISGDETLFSVNMGIWFPVSVGNRVWFDDDGNGIQDPDEPGVSNVGVSLFTIDDDGVLSYTEQRTQTDDDGFYTFGDLAPAIYLVEFDLMTLPQDHQPTLPNSGTDDALDSDASTRSAASAPTAFLASGASDTTLDLGLTTTVEIGDKVWVDNDLDGYQDEDEVGLGGVEILLYEENGQLRGTTTSDRGGWYLFQDILPGTYYIAVQVPNGREFSPHSVGRYAAADSDIDPSTGESEPITLRAGDSASDLDIGLSGVVPTGVERVQHQLFVPLMQ